MPYVYKPYPKVVYHQTKQPKVVYNLAEWQALGEGWVENPFASNLGDMPAGTVDADGFIVAAGAAPTRIVEAVRPGGGRVFTHYVKDAGGTVRIVSEIEFED